MYNTNLIRYTAASATERIVSKMSNLFTILNFIPILVGAPDILASMVHLVDCLCIDFL